MYRPTEPRPIVSGIAVRILHVGVILLLTASVRADGSGPKISFSRDIRPLLSDLCFKCHGPDEEHRASELRLDIQSGAFADLGGRHAIVAGDPAASELVARISSTDPEKRMPPADSGRELTEYQKTLLAEWVRQGAEWNDHWAFVAPERPVLPQTSRRSWSRNPIDDFVLARLEQDGLQPSAEADRSTLIRRVTLDLTGLPPTAAEVTAFVADSAPDAYDRLVDRLLRSPRYGEKMAISWLDAARYADTSGYQNDGPRQMWRWRDWVISAFNSNLPFDQFTIEQIAGDLLEQPTLDQRIATGFNRNHRGNAEGGIVPEEYQVEYVVDRVDTTFTVWMGLTMGCARCHDHKYDPLRQRDFYQVFAYFNNIPEYGRAIKEGNAPPYLLAPTAAEQQRLEELDRQVSEAAALVSRNETALNAARDAWEAAYTPAEPIDWSVSDGLVSHLRLDGDLNEAVSGKPGTAEPAGVTFQEGRVNQGVWFDASSFVSAGDTAGFGYFDRFSIAAWVKPTSGNGTIVSRMVPEEEGRGYYVHLKDGHIQVNLINRWLDDAVRVESREPLKTSEWQHVTVTYDGSRVAQGIQVYVDGQAVAMEVRLDRLNSTYAVPEPLRIGSGHSPFAGGIDDVRIYSRDLTPDEAGLLSVAESASAILALPAAARTDFQQRKLTRYFLANAAPESLRNADQQLTALQRQRRDFYSSISTVMVMQEMETPRDTHILVRGQYDNPGEKVSAGVPAAFPPLADVAPNNRLGFARWLVDPRHPLTARVTVNRFWQQYFGIGLVKTAEDFGAQGELPSHPELLDWLAREFIETGWNVKELQKLIVSSSSYRQSSKVSPRLLQHDPENRLLARGPRVRLPAETIRDQALLVSGLLTDAAGGPSVRPYQPEGLWMEIATDTEYVQSHGADLYRRSLYTYWKRTSAPPTMVTLDATSREACIVQRTRTNTPLQALALMNDPTFVEAARVLAQKVMETITGSPDDRIARAFYMITARQPRPQERTILVSNFNRSLAMFQEKPEAATQLISTGEFPRNEQLDPAILAAYTAVASLILNLDEVVTKE